MLVRLKNDLFLKIQLELLSSFFIYQYIYSTLIDQNLLVNSRYLYQLIFFVSKTVFFKYNSLIDICLVDYQYLGLTGRFNIIYNILSYKYSSRFFCSILLKTPVISSVSNCYNSATWLEREV